MSLHTAGRKERKERIEEYRGVFDGYDKPDWVFRIRWDADFKISVGRASRSYIVQFRKPIPLAELNRILAGVEKEIEQALLT